MGNFKLSYTRKYFVRSRCMYVRNFNCLYGKFSTLKRHSTKYYNENRNKNGGAEMFRILGSVLSKQFTVIFPRVWQRVFEAIRSGSFADSPHLQVVGNLSLTIPSFVGQNTLFNGETAKGTCRKFRPSINFARFLLSRCSE